MPFERAWRTAYTTPMIQIPSRGGTYILVIHLARPACIRVGALGERPFAAGHYLYVGSALGGLSVRLRRHLRREKRMRWHIDYLLAQARVTAVVYRPGTERLECRWAMQVATMPGVHACTAPFGASDCGCRTHLFYSPAAPNFDLLRAVLAEEPTIVPLAPEAGADTGPDVGAHVLTE
ncbi:MAG: GIY-YIG nuclease family protein [Anaerolineae bacterium]